MNCYIINEKTLYLGCIDAKNVINESGIELEITNMDTKKIINCSCLFYGTSYQGRKKGTKNMINETYKLPIILNESKKIVIFPIYSLKSKKNFWIVYNNIKNYQQISKSKVLVEFINGFSKVFHISYYIFHNQMSKCSRLLIVYTNRNN